MIVKGRRVEMLRDREAPNFSPPVGEQFIAFLPDELRKLIEFAFVPPRLPESSPSFDAPLTAAEHDN